MSRLCGSAVRAGAREQSRPPTGPAHRVEGLAGLALSALEVVESLAGARARRFLVPPGCLDRRGCHFPPAGCPC
ncbi:MAG: hypothetical protein R3195_14240 [Gemmatimonadota bacterium]|nr:hypothetical protein [Gemmatimonadota bacterium]